jgi:pantothenate kinase
VSGRVAALARDILARAEGRRRYVFAVAGAPGAGKSTLAEALVAELERIAPGQAALVPMDGFHLDNAVLEERGLLPRKGAPETFDVDGFAATLARVRAAEGPVAVPVFDRSLDLARAGARIIEAGRRVIVVEGNYLLLEDAPWSGLAAQFDRTLFLRVDEAELARRLVDRWLGHGFEPAAARARAEGNDLPNARLVLARSRPADIVWTGG